MLLSVYTETSKKNRPLCVDPGGGAGADPEGVADADTGFPERGEDIHKHPPWTLSA